MPLFHELSVVVVASAVFILVFGHSREAQTQKSFRHHNAAVFAAKPPADTSADSASGDSVPFAERTCHRQKLFALNLQTLDRAEDADGDEGSSTDDKKGSRSRPARKKESDRLQHERGWRDYSGENEEGSESHSGSALMT